MNSRAEISGLDIPWTASSATIRSVRVRSRCPAVRTPARLRSVLVRVSWKEGERDLDETVQALLVNPQ